MRSITFAILLILGANFLNAQRSTNYYIYSDIGISVQKFKTTIPGGLQDEFSANFPRVEYSQPSVAYNVGIAIEKIINPQLKILTCIDVGKIGHQDKIQAENLPNPITSNYKRYHSRLSIFLEIYLFSHQLPKKRKRKKKEIIPFMQVGSINSFAFAESYKFNNENAIEGLWARNKFLMGYMIGAGIDKGKFEVSWQFTSYFSNLFKVPSVIKHTYFSHSIRVAYKLNKK